MLIEFTEMLLDENDIPFECFCSCYITVERDPAGTGDSPMEYEVDMRKVLVNGQPHTLTARQEERMTKTALEIMQG